MNGGQLPTNQLHDINWGALAIDHASRAAQLMSTHVTTICVCVCVEDYGRLWLHVFRFFR